jgi:hypothetical protein
MPSDSDARVWLRTIGLAMFDELADQLDRITESWAKRGVKTRRSWWENLAGTANGTPRVSYGITFPIIAAVRERFGMDPIKGAIELPPNMVVPPMVKQARWTKKRAIKRTAVAQKTRKPAGKSKKR